MNVVRRSVLVTGVTAGATFLALAVAPSANAVIVPKVTRVSPSTGFTAGGARVTVTGSGFSHVAAVYFGATKGSSIKVLSTTALTVTAPAHVDGRVDVRVKTTTAESPITTVDRFTYLPTPVSAVSEPGATSHTLALSWTNPKDPYFNGGVIRRNVGTTAPTSATTGTASGTFSKSTHMLVVSGLSPGTTYAFSVFARDADGHYAAAAKLVRHTLALSAPVLADPSHGDPTAVTCVSTTLCAMVDQTGSASSYNGSSWTPPGKVDLTTGLTDISCAGTSASLVCATVGGGNAHTFVSGGNSWVDATIDSAWGLTSVSCAGDAASALCAAVDQGGNAFTFNGASWSGPTAVDPNHQLNAVSCATTSLCVAVDDSGQATVYTGTWSAPAATTTTSNLRGISCATTTFCLATADDGAATLFNGASWAVRNTPLDEADAVSCVSTTFCVALDEFRGYVSIFNGASWGVLHSTDSGFTAMVDISCASTTMCIALEPNGRYYVFNGAAYDAEQTAETFQLPAGVTCATASFCAIGDTMGQWSTGDASNAWTVPAQTNMDEFDSMSCVNATFCVGVGGISVAVYKGAGWLTSVLNTFSRWNSVSCASTTFCAAVDDGGDVAFYNGSKWSASGRIELEPLTNVACSSSTLCVAVDDAGRLLNFNGSTWSAPTYVDTYNYAGRLSCAINVRFCVAADNAGNVAYFDGSSWSGLSSITTEPITGVSCLATRYCYAATSTALIGFGQGLMPARDALPVHGFRYDVSCVAGPVCALSNQDGEVIRAA